MMNKKPNPKNVIGERQGQLGNGKAQTGQY